ncbi:hypothetical protein ACFRR6_20145 [Streptomyces sp. NPDC056891]|uniref:hypothetical protein n=1 Tax=Streptomyces sp. NPDC056891 TaxID=3345961 RepID=UPI0036AFC142
MIAELVAAGSIKIDLPDTLAHHPAITSARIYSLNLNEWRQRWTKVTEEQGEEELTDNDASYGWTAAIEIESEDLVFLVPQDEVSTDARVELFTKAGDLLGRLRMTGEMRDGSLLVRHTHFEANLHCIDCPCDSHVDCGDCCDGCACVGVYYRGIRGLKCRCDVHGSA